MKWEIAKTVAELVWDVLGLIADLVWIFCGLAFVGFLALEASGLATGSIEIHLDFTPLMEAIGAI